MGKWRLEEKSGGCTVYAWSDGMSTHKRVRLTHKGGSSWIATLYTGGNAALSANGIHAKDAVISLINEICRIADEATEALSQAKALDFEGFPFEVPKKNTNGGE